MGPEAAVNAVFANKIAAIEDPEARSAFVAEQRSIYEEDVDLLRLASELIIDAITQGGPGTASETINLYLYSVAFAYYDVGYGSAIAVVFLISR